MEIYLLIGDCILRLFISFLIVMLFSYILKIDLKGTRFYLFLFVVFLIVSATLPVIVSYWLPRIR